MREESKEKRALQKAEDQIFADVVQTITQRNARPLGNDVGDRREQWRECKGEQQIGGPCQRRVKWLEPAHDEGKKRRGRRKRTAHIVQQLPPPGRRKGASLGIVVPTGAATEKPR